MFALVHTHRALTDVLSSMFPLSRHSATPKRGQGYPEVSSPRGEQDGATARIAASVDGLRLS